MPRIGFELGRALEGMSELASAGYGMSNESARALITTTSQVFTFTLVDAGHPARDVLRLTTKFRDAGRRSPPWRPTSSRVPGRPQDGADGNRINRWMLARGHKFYAAEVTATLVEVKYYLQALSMTGAPALPTSISDAFAWLIEHPVRPGEYNDPIQLIPIELPAIVRNARDIQSGHLIPLDRGGVHEPNNAFLMLARSNQLQGNQTLDELLQLMRQILERHRSYTGSLAHVRAGGTARRRP